MKKDIFRFDWGAAESFEDLVPEILEDYIYNKIHNISLGWRMDRLKIL